MIVGSTTDNSLCKRLFRECDLTLSEAIIAGHPGEETCKDARKIVRAQSITNIDKIFKRKPTEHSHNKNVNFAIVRIPKANAQLMEKFVMFAINIIISKFASNVLVKRVHKTESDESHEPFDQSDYDFLLKLLKFKLRIY